MKVDGKNVKPLYPFQDPTMTLKIGYESFCIVYNDTKCTNIKWHDVVFVNILLKCHYIFSSPHPLILRKLTHQSFQQFPKRFRDDSYLPSLETVSKVIFYQVTTVPLKEMIFCWRLKILKGR